MATRGPAGREGKKGREGGTGREARWRGGAGRGSSGTKKGRAGTSERVGLGVGGRVGTTGARPVRPDRSRWTNARLAAAPRVRGRLGGVWQGRRVARRGGGGAAGLASPLPPPRARSAASNRQRRVAGMRGPTGAAGGGSPRGSRGRGCGVVCWAHRYPVAPHVPTGGPGIRRSPLGSRVRPPPPQPTVPQPRRTVPLSPARPPSPPPLPPPVGSSRRGRHVASARALVCGQPDRRQAERGSKEGGHGHAAPPVAPDDVLTPSPGRPPRGPPPRAEPRPPTCPPAQAPPKSPAPHAQGVRGARAPNKTGEGRGAAQPRSPPPEASRAAWPPLHTGSAPRLQPRRTAAQMPPPPRREVPWEGVEAVEHPASANTRPGGASSATTDAPVPPAPPPPPESP